MSSQFMFTIIALAYFNGIDKTLGANRKFTPKMSKSFRFVAVAGSPKSPRAL